VGVGPTVSLYKTIDNQVEDTLDVRRISCHTSGMTNKKTMQKRPIYPIHPGEILADELVELNKTPTELARELYVPANRISQLIAGKRAMTADTALRLERRLGVSAAFWMNLQKRYELDLARDRTGDALSKIEPLLKVNG
jgi:addiction module HigA family antidote